MRSPPQITAHTVGAHRLSLLRNGEELFPARRDAIDAARRSIAVEMYWVEDDAAGREFRDGLVRAAKRGVDVRLVVDGFGSATLPRGWHRPLLAAGGRVRTFRPMLATLDPRRPLGVLARDHRKMTVVDGEVAFVGGMNVCAKWLPRSEGGEDWRDTALRIEGRGVGAHLERLFETTWARIGRQPLPEAPPMVWVAESGRVGVLANSPQERRGRKIRQAYLWGLRRAKKSIDITCAYFAPRAVFVHALAAAVRRGVRVRLLVPAKSDVWLADVFARSSLHVLAAAGAEVYAYEGAVLHAKTAIVDARLTTVGSHNLDALSWAHNLECNVVIDDRWLGEEARRMFEADLALSRRLYPKAPSRATAAVSRLLDDGLRWFYERRW